MIYTGDMLNQVPVISKLNVSQLEPGKIYRFMFQGADMNIGQSWYVPVMVAVGVEPGPRLLLNTGIHGDEFNGSKVIQQLFSELDPEALSGAVIGVIQAAPNALLHINRNWYLSTDGGDYVNMNRVFPGNRNGNSGEVHAYRLWHNLWRNNVDLVVDLHSQSTDTIYPLFMYADLSIAAVARLAEQIAADQIFDSPDGEGTVEGTFDVHGIPAITLEIGAARIYQPALIERTLNGLRNILIEYKMLNGYKTATASQFGTKIGKTLSSVKAKTGGYAEVLVQIGDQLESNQEIARQYNPFGDLIARYVAPVAGVVASVGSGATRESGGLLVRILS